jgi:hypothetical protein
MFFKPAPHFPNIFLDIPQNFREWGSKQGFDKQIGDILCGKEFLGDFILAKFSIKIPKELRCCMTTGSY